MSAAFSSSSGRCPSLGRHGDADAGADEIGWPSIANGRPACGTSLRQGCRLGQRADLELDHRELVAAEPRTRSPARTAGRSRSATACRSLSPTGWPSLSLTLLEAVEVEAVHGETGPSGGRHRRLELLAEQRAVGEVGQRIVAGEVHDLRFVPAALGDVGERAHEATIGKRISCARAAQFRRAGRARTSVSARCPRVRGYIPERRARPWLPHG